MRQATYKVVCDFCGRVYEYDNWEPWNGHHTPEPTMRIINKDACRACLMQMLQLAENTIQPHE